MKVEIVYVVAAAVIGALSWVSAAFGQAPVCLPRAQALDMLEKQHGEKPWMLFVGDNGMLIEMTKSPDGGWTMMHLRPDGTLCLLLSGSDMRQARGT